MATAMSAIFVPIASLASSNTRKIKSKFMERQTGYTPKFSIRTRKYPSRKPPSCSCTNGTVVQGDRNTSELPMSIDALHRFIRLNLGNWTGSFHVSINPPPCTTSLPGDDYEAEWFEYRIKETNMLTMDKYQQISSSQGEAHALRYQTAGMLETVLRQGVLGEDDNGEESPRNLKLPSKRHSIICENCLYSVEEDRRVRAFHTMDPKGILETILVFLEERGNREAISPLTISRRILPHFGTRKGHSRETRTGVYGATITEADITAVLEMNKEGQLVQDIKSTSGASNITTNVHWTGTMSENLVTFKGGFQLILLPGGIYMGYPSDVTKNVQEPTSFHLEFCWLESPSKRQTYSHL